MKENRSLTSEYRHTYCMSVQSVCPRLDDPKNSDRKCQFAGELNTKLAIK